MQNYSLNTGWSEFWVKLIEDIKAFFNPDLSGYKNFSFGSTGLINVNVIIFGIYIGVLLAAGYSIYTKNVLGKIVRKVLDSGAIDGENAKSLHELGYGNNWFIKFALRGYTLNRVLKSIEREEFIAETNKARAEYEEKRSALKKEGRRLPPFAEPKFTKKPDECRYFIAEKDRYTAEMRFNANGSGYGTFFFVLLLASICVIIVYSLLPHILIVFDNTLNDFTVEGNTYIPGQ